MYTHHTDHTISQTYQGVNQCCRATQALNDFYLHDYIFLYKMSCFCTTTSGFVFFVLFFPPDAVYTERYMGTPTENSDSYKVSSTQAETSSYLCHLTSAFLNWFEPCGLNRTPPWQPEPRTLKQWTIFWFTEQQMVRSVFTSTDCCSFQLVSMTVPFSAPSG